MAFQVQTPAPDPQASVARVAPVDWFGAAERGIEMATDLRAADEALEVSLQKRRIESLMAPVERESVAATAEATRETTKRATALHPFDIRRADLLNNQLTGEIMQAAMAADDAHQTAILNNNRLSLTEPFVKARAAAELSALEAGANLAQINAQQAQLRTPFIAKQVGFDLAELNAREEGGALIAAGTRAAIESKNAQNERDDLLILDRLEDQVITIKEAFQSGDHKKIFDAVSTAHALRGQLKSKTARAQAAEAADLLGEQTVSVNDNGTPREIRLWPWFFRTQAGVPASVPWTEQGQQRILDLQTKFGNYYIEGAQLEELAALNQTKTKSALAQLGVDMQQVTSKLAATSLQNQLDEQTLIAAGATSREKLAELENYFNIRAAQLKSGMLEYKGAFLTALNNGNFALAGELMGREGSRLLDDISTYEDALFSQQEQLVNSQTSPVTLGGVPVEMKSNWKTDYEDLFERRNTEIRGRLKTLRALSGEQRRELGITPEMYSAALTSLEKADKTPGWYVKYLPFISPAAAILKKEVSLGARAIEKVTGKALGMGGRAAAATQIARDIDALTPDQSFRKLFSGSGVNQALQMLKVRQAQYNTLMDRLNKASGAVPGAQPSVQGGAYPDVYGQP